METNIQEVTYEYSKFSAYNKLCTLRKWDALFYKHAQLWDEGGIMVYIWGPYFFDATAFIHILPLGSSLALTDKP